MLYNRITTGKRRNTVILFMLFRSQTVARTEYVILFIILLLL